MISGIIVVGAKGAAEVWDVLNKDDRISKAVQGLGTQVANALNSGTPQARLEKQLALIEEYAFKAAERPEQADDATRWLRQATSIRERLPLVATMKGRTGKGAMRDLQTRTSDLLTEIITRDLED